MKNKSSNKAANDKSSHGKTEKGGVGYMTYTHRDDCPKLKGKECNCTPIIKIVGRAEYLKTIQLGNK
ncbi:MAG: hypothetical protein ACI8PB_000338 [Desulforhopalus sp.]|jgi:hypothetical protein